jgi:hypothetical protein
MRRIAAISLLIAVAGCAGYSGRGLVPGQSSEADVEAVMGEPAGVQEKANGETVLWYPRLRYGRENYAARIGPDGRLLSIEQRLTEENIARLVRNQTLAEEVSDLLGPPHRSDPFPRMEREIWTYYMQGFPYWKVLYVQISPQDHVVREVYYMDDPEARPRGGRGWR